MRVLIIQTAPLAEIIAALPVLDYLHQAVAGVEIDWVVEESLADVLEGNPLLALLHPVRAAQWRALPKAVSTLRELGALKETLVAREYRFVFDLEGTFNSGLISRFTKAPDRIGFERSEVRERVNTAFAMRRVPMRRQDAHLSHRFLRLVGIPFAKDFREMELSCDVQVSREDHLAAEVLLATLSDGLVFLFHLGADAPTKLWSEQSWIELGNRVREDFPDCSILLSCEDDQEREAAVAVARGIEGARILGRQSLKGLAALLKKVDLVVGGDTDTVQLAAALGTPTVSFYRSTDAKKSGPLGEQHVVIQSPIHCTRCLRSGCDKDLQCRATIKVESVYQAVMRQFSGGSRG